MKDSRKLKNDNLIDAFLNAINGFKYTFKTQINIRIQIIIAIIVISVGIFLELEKIEIICLIFSIFLVIFAEMINTSIESCIDLYTDEYKEKAKIAKDVSAGAVLIASINSVIVGYFLFFEKILNIIY